MRGFGFIDFLRVENSARDSVSVRRCFGEAFVDSKKVSEVHEQFSVNALAQGEGLFGAGERTRTVDQWVNSVSPRKKSLPLVHCSTELSYAGAEPSSVELNNIVTVC